MQDRTQGKYFHGYAENDTGGATQVALNDADGNAITLAKGERLIIDEMSIMNGDTAVGFHVFFGDDSAVQVGTFNLWDGWLDVNRNASFPSAGSASIYTPRAPVAGSAVVFTTSVASSTVRLTILGRIIKS